MNEQISNQSVVDKIREQLKIAIETTELEELLKNNFAIFEYKGVKYKVSKPTPAVRREAYAKRAEKHMELLTDSKFQPEEILRKTYKSKGIDIDALDSKLLVLEGQKNVYQLKIGDGLASKVPDGELLAFKAEIEKINEEQRDISIKKTNYLEYSIENQVNIFTYSYLTWLITQKEVEGNWVPSFSSYDEFLNGEEELINKITVRASFLIMPAEISI